MHQNTSGFEETTVHSTKIRLICHNRDKPRESVIQVQTSSKSNSSHRLLSTLMPETLTTSSARRGIPIFQLHNSKSLLKYEVQQHNWGSLAQFVLKFLNMCLLLWRLQGTVKPCRHRCSYLSFMFMRCVHFFFFAAHTIWFSKENPFETFLILCSDISHIISYHPPHDAGNWLTGCRSRGTDFTPEYYSFCNSPSGKIFRPRMTLHNMKKKKNASDFIIVTSSAITQQGAVKRFGRRTESQNGTVIRMLIITRV